MKIDCNFQTPSKAKLKGQKHRASLPEQILCYYRQVTVDRIRRQFLKAYCGRGVPGSNFFPKLSLDTTPEYSWTPRGFTVWQYSMICLEIWTTDKIHEFCHSFQRSGAVFTVLGEDYWFPPTCFQTWIHLCKVRLKANFHWRFTIVTTENQDLSFPTGEMLLKMSCNEFCRF